MSYQSFYQDNFNGVTNGYAENNSSYESTGYGIDGSEAFFGGNTSFEAAGYNANNFEQQTSSGATNYATDAQGLYQDPNPQVIQRPAAEGVKTYTQRVVVRFLQPPPVPPPGPLIIKEVRPPQPPPPPPLYIRQRPPLPPTLPPIVIREAPPKVPAAVGTQSMMIITKMLPPLPVPPRSVIIERLPPLPPKPHDIIVERWLPYRTTEKRRIIIQRAPPPVLQKPRNIIIYYETPKTQIVRRFQNLGVQPANPSDYIAQYGAQLADAQTLVSQARQAGVVEDISPPTSHFQSSTYENYQSNSETYDSSFGDNTSYESYSSAQTFT